jgi:YVTN family beta-propeller protein
VALAFDNANDSLYVANKGSDTVTVISGSTQQVEFNVTVDSAPDALAYDPINEEVFVANSGSNNVSIINVSSNAVTGNFSVGSSPAGLDYGASPGAVFVANSGSNNVSVVGVGPNASHTLIATVGVGSTPVAIAYDNVSGAVFVANEASGNVSEIADEPIVGYEVVGSVAVGSDPVGVTDISSLSEVIVANSGSSTLSVINCTVPTPIVVATIPSIPSPDGAAFDADQGQIQVTDPLADTLSLVSVSDDPPSDALVGSIGLGTTPSSVAVDADGALFFVANETADAIDMVSSNNDTIQLVIPVGIAPDAIVYDNESSQIFVANSGSSSVSVIDVPNGTLAKTVSVDSDPVAEVFVPGSPYGTVYVANEGSNSVSLVDDATDSLLLTVEGISSPSALTYDSALGEVFVAERLANQVAFISTQSHTVVGEFDVEHGPVALAYDPLQGEIWVACANTGNVIAIYDTNGSQGPSVPVPGLTALAFDGSTDSVLVTSNLSGPGDVEILNASAAGSVVGSFGVGADPVAITYDPLSAIAYVSNYRQGTVSVARLIVPPRNYNVTFNESGLAAGTSWSVTLDGSPESSLDSSMIFREPNGTYAFQIGAVPGFIQSITSGQLTVDGASVNQQVQFLEKYEITFSQTGLPSATDWSVNLNGTLNASTTSSIGFWATNGTYPFSVFAISGYNSTPSLGSVQISGANVEESILFQALVPPTPTYSITFRESTLPSGTNWTVVVNGTSETSSNSTVVFSEPNGTYNYTVPSDGNWTPTRTNGTLTIAGRGLSPAVAFDYTYLVTFNEPTGVASGTPWTVALTGAGLLTLDPGSNAAGGASHTSPAAAITFTEPNGTYRYTITIASLPLYSATGIVRVSGNSPVVTPPPASAPPTGGSPGSSIDIDLVVGIVALGMIVSAISAVVVYVYYRRHPRPVGPSPREPEPEYER